jgi:hypothetical protein
MAKRPRRIWLYGAGRHMFCCAGRPNTCNNLSLLQAEASEFHDSRLQEATDQVNRIFAGLQSQAPEGHHLALLDTSLGLLLAWAEESERPDDLTPYVSADSAEGAIRDALGLGGEASAA